MPSAAKRDHRAAAGFQQALEARQDRGPSLGDAVRILLPSANPSWVSVSFTSLPCGSIMKTTLRGRSLRMSSSMDMLKACRTAAAAGRLRGSCRRRWWCRSMHQRERRADLPVGSRAQCRTSSASVNSLEVSACPQFLRRGLDIADVDEFGLSAQAFSFARGRRIDYRGRVRSPSRLFRLASTIGQPPEILRKVLPPSSRLSCVTVSLMTLPRGSRSKVTREVRSRLRLR